MKIKEQAKLVDKLYKLKKKLAVLACEEERMVSVLKEIIPTNSVAKYEKYHVMHTLFEATTIPSYERKEYTTILIKRV